MNEIEQALTQMIKLGNDMNWEPPIDQEFVDALNGLRRIIDAAQQPRVLDEAPRACIHANMLPSEPHGFLYCPDCGLRQ